MGLISFSFVGSAGGGFLKGTLAPLTGCAVLVAVASELIRPLLPQVKGKESLIVVLAAIIGVSVCGLMLYTVLSPVYRATAGELLQRFRARQANANVHG